MFYEVELILISLFNIVSESILIQFINILYHLLLVYYWTIHKISNLIFKMSISEYKKYIDDFIKNKIKL